MFDHRCFFRHALILQTLFGDDDDDSFFDKKPAASKPVAKAAAGALHAALTLFMQCFCIPHFFSAAKGKSLFDDDDD
jgi:hypothetical protein